MDMPHEPTAQADALLTRAGQGDAAAFDDLVAAHRRELFAHCYRMLGSLEDAEDALQETLLNAWKGLRGFEGRSSLRTWLYRISTNVCIRSASGRGPRILSTDHGPPLADPSDLGEPVTEPIWLEPWPDQDPAERYLRREGVELAFLAALQHLPGTQRAVLILREVLGYSAAEAAEILDTTAASVNSALQRARKAVGERMPATTQRAELDALGEDGRRALVEAFVSAWERADVDALVSLLADDARFTMPPLPAWFDGVAAVRRFFAERVFATAWRLVPIQVNGQLGFACYQERDGRLRLSAINALGVRAGLVSEISGFIDPAVLARSGLPEEFPPER
ncbi:RNA polymerase sigma-70 factor (ECF subfamily) [Actinomadura namibiensis]|uniref:RNA polymerase sigma-70 factor (ECF subfamily) n=2 Tax=Actinomadura TaxID=1988 RepID=A0A7W3QMY6_ACTNM|nr:RNA polymerase sigma-70 factor (ECF subfamily) [Actinomadura namibiensis]